MANENKMSKQNNANEYLKIREKFAEVFSEERLKSTLDFVDYLEESGRLCEFNPDDPCICFDYMGEYSGLFLYEKNEDITMSIWFLLCWRNNCDVSEHENFPVDENLKEFAQKNIHKCTECGGCRSYGFGPTSRIIFGKEFDNVCNDVFHFYSPEGDELKNVIRLMELQKHIIADNKRP